MNNNFLFAKNNTKLNIKNFFRDKRYVFQEKTKEFGDKTLKKVIAFVNTVSEAIRLPVVIDFGKVELQDKLSYVLLEYICYYLIKVKGVKCCVNIGFEKHIDSYNAKSSPLRLLNYRNIFSEPSAYKKTCEEYIKKFEYDTDPRHIRKIIKKEDLETATASKLITDIKTTLKNSGIGIEQAEKVSEVVGELIDNSGDHAKSDCLVDIDITPDHIKHDEEGLYYGVNIVVFDLSEQLLGEKIKEFLQKSNGNKEWYGKLEKAREFHKNYWNDKYTERDFFIMSAFQNRISSRKANYTTGGTGLTKLIGALEFQSDAYLCFVWTGNRKMEFRHELLMLNEDGWVGFNAQKNFLSEPPDVTILEDTEIFFPGTAYNLSFVLRRDKNG